MVSDRQNAETKKAFEPLQIMGTFWAAFGVVVLVASFFVKATPQVPLVRGVATNIIAGTLLLGAGIFCIVKGRAKKGEKA